MAMKEYDAVDCWIDGCPWFQNMRPPGNRLSQDERDAITVEHIRAAHPLPDVEAEIERRQIELGPAPWRRFIQEQIEDRNAIIYILQGTVRDWD